MTVVVVVVAVVVSSIRVSSERGHNCFSHSSTQLEGKCVWGKGKRSCHMIDWGC